MNSPSQWQRLSTALRSTRLDWGRRIGNLVGADREPLSGDQLEELEAQLITSDLGLEVTEEILETIRRESARASEYGRVQLLASIRTQLLSMLNDYEKAPKEVTQPPRVILMVGVNGVGKTSTVGKLADRLRKQGESVLIAASDTFRAAATEQLAIWADRAGVELVRQGAGADPAAVLFDAIQACRARKITTLIVDTAGRLHTKSHLMQELQKMGRVAGRQVEGAPHEVYLVLDATVGQNSLTQARQFLDCLGLTGIVITKLDGTAKGGAVIAIARELKIPIRYVGVGEGLEDLLPFSPEAFVDALVAADSTS